jgi:hypothetical protein
LLWAVESGPLPIFGGSNRFKWLINWLGRVKSPKVMHITLTDPERI